MCPLSVTIYETFANKIKYQKYDLENEGRYIKRRKMRLCQTTVNARVYIGEFIEF